MYCPVCETEYRSGFTKCSDCGVDLVPELPDPESVYSYAALWKGEDAVFHDALVAKLEEAGIEYGDTPLHIFARNNPNFIGASLGPHFGFVISVRTPDLPAARAILEQLLDVEPDELPYEIHARPSETVAGSVPELPFDWDPGTATVELISGELETRIAFLEDALREVGIPTRRDVAEDGVLRVMIRPEDETRGTAIRDQIAEQTAPATDLPEPKPSIWDEEPVRSYALLYYLLFPYLLCSILVLAGSGAPGRTDDLIQLLAAVLAVVSAVGQIGSYWMMYQAIRYEIRPLKFFLLAFLPLSFVWYYFERYATRRGPSRFPIAIRMRMNPPRT